MQPPTNQPSNSIVPVVTALSTVPAEDLFVDLLASPVEQAHANPARAYHWPVHLTDAGNARLLVQRHGRDLHYCESLGRWQLWDSRRWEPCDHESIMARAKQTVREMHSVAWRIPDLENRATVVKHILSSEAENRLRSMISLAKSEPGIPVLDCNPLVLNCLNGTVDLRTGKLHPHRREDLITKLAPVSFLPDAKCPLFEAFVRRIMAENDGLIRYLQRAIGYALTAKVVEKAIFFLFGSGENGKTTLLEALRKMLGDYAGQLPIESLMMKKSDGGIPNDIAILRGLRFVSSSETEHGQKLAASKIKYLTGNATVQARFLHKEFFEFPPTHKIFMDANHKPVVRGDDDAIWRRIRNIPFTVSVPKAEQDLALPEKLANELPGILAWAVRGCLAWQEYGLAEPEDVKLATQAYRQEMDSAAMFLAECCEFGKEYQQPTKDLFAAYESWCRETGDQPDSMKAFGAMLGRRDGVVSRRTSKSRFWTGLRLKPDTGDSQTIE